MAAGTIEDDESVSLVRIMASSQSSLLSERAKLEHIITEFFAKSRRIIIESRSPCASSWNYSREQTLSSPSSSSSSSVRPKDKDFNLALRDCPEALENIDLWRQSSLEPIVIDVILVQRPTDWNAPHRSPRRNNVGNLSFKERFPNCFNSRQEDYLEEMSEKIIERWILQYESRRSRDSSSSGSKRKGGTSSHSLYKKSNVLLRSLYLTVRLLPAYKLFRELNSSGQIRSFGLAHRVCSFVEPFTRRDETNMQKFVFVPVDISCGRLSLTVLYHPTLSYVSLEPSVPLSLQLIPDHVGSPTTEPFRRFSSPLIGLTPHGSSAAFQQRHSWTLDLFKASAPSGSLSSSPSCSEPRVLPSNLSSNRLPPLSLPRHLPETPISPKNASFDEYWPSPIISPSPSPSPPTHYSGGHFSNTLLRSEGAPLNIPAAKIGENPGITNSHILPPSPSCKSTRHGSSQADTATAVLKFGEVHGSITIEKMYSIGKDEAGNLSGARRSSNGSPWISFSRSSSRLSFPDDFDDSDFCLFAVDGNDIVDPHTRAESFDGKGNLSMPIESEGLLPAKQSQDAAVGVLVQMLKTAAPLRQDFSNSIRSSQVSEPETGNKSIQEPGRTSKSKAVAVQNTSSYSSHTPSGPLTSKTTADALKELLSYREMKDLLIRQGSGLQMLARDGAAAETMSTDVHRDFEIL